VARDLTDRCSALIDAGAAATVVPLLCKAVDRMATALMYMDDSSGIVGDDLQQVMDLYARACAAAPPDPERLAGWLVKLECDGPGWPRNLVRDFAPALGASGLTEVERLVAERAEATDPESWTGQFAIRDLREQLAEVSGDVDRYVNVLAEHLESAIQYGRIVDALRARGRTAEAVAWARRGLAEETGRPHADDLRDALVALFLEEGDAEAALVVRRAEFERHPTLAAYGAWASAAARVGTGDVTAAAVERLRQRIAEQPAYVSELVDVLTATGSHDQAWAIGQANPDRLGRPRWLTLLVRRSATTPADVIEPYQNVVEAQVNDSSDKNRYRRVLPLLSALQAAYRAAGQEDRFAAYLADFRDRHRRRPTLIKTLDGAGFRA
jgi:hypothetical protein